MHLIGHSWRNLVWLFLLFSFFDDVPLNFFPSICYLVWLLLAIQNTNWTYQVYQVIRYMTDFLGCCTPYNKILCRISTIQMGRCSTNKGNKCRLPNPNFVIHYSLFSKWLIKSTCSDLTCGIANPKVTAAIVFKLSSAHNFIASVQPLTKITWSTSYLLGLNCLTL